MLLHLVWWCGMCVALTADQRDVSVSHQVDQLRQCISILFAFQRRPTKDNLFVTDTRQWLSRLVSSCLIFVVISSLCMTDQAWAVREITEFVWVLTGWETTVGKYCKSDYLSNYDSGNSCCSISHNSIWSLRHIICPSVSTVLNVNYRCSYCWSTCTSSTYNILRGCADLFSFLLWWLWW